MIYFVKGLMLGFAYVAPIGVQNLFAVNTSLTQTKKRAYITAFVIMFFDITRLQIKKLTDLHCNFVDI